MRSSSSVLMKEEISDIVQQHPESNTSSEGGTVLEKAGRVLEFNRPLGDTTDMASHCNLIREELQAAQTNTVSLWASGAAEQTVRRQCDH